MGFCFQLALLSGGNFGIFRRPSVFLLLKHRIVSSLSVSAAAGPRPASGCHGPAVTMPHPERASWQGSRIKHSDAAVWRFALLALAGLDNSASVAQPPPQGPMLMPPGYSPNYPANSAQVIRRRERHRRHIRPREPQDNRGMGHRPAPAIRPQDLLPLHIPPPVREHSPRRRMAHTRRATKQAPSRQEGPTAPSLQRKRWSLTSALKATGPWPRTRSWAKSTPAPAGLITCRTCRTTSAP